MQALTAIAAAAGAVAIAAGAIGVYRATRSAETGHAFGYPHTSPEALTLARRYAMPTTQWLRAKRLEWQLRGHARILRIIKPIERYSAARAAEAMHEIRVNIEAWKESAR